MNRGDRWLVVLALMLTMVGLVMVYSSGSFFGFVRYGDASHFLKAQLLRTALGVGVLFLCMKLDLRWLERLAPVLLTGACILLLLVVVMGHMSNGATRWLRVGFMSLQPTDLGRLAAVIFLAWWLKRRPVEELGFAKGMLPPLALLGLVAGLILKQPNLSSAGLLLMTGLTMLFLSGAPKRFLLVPVGGGVAVVMLALATHTYMMTRVQTFLGFVMKGQLESHGAGWQLDQSLIAIGSGGILGRGLGEGLQKLLFLPEAHTDFIFSIIAEELGFIGATVLLALIGLFLWRGLRVAARASEPFACLLAGGLTVQIGLYALANLAVATGVAPTTGLPLPFVSYGGSALLVNLAAVGILYRISGMNGTEDALARQRWSREAA
ncbi:MAG: putative lipid II flippase FtsW [Candidatus Eisenbacteria bacterium]